MIIPNDANKLFFFGLWAGRRETETRLYLVSTYLLLVVIY